MGGLADASAGSVIRWTAGPGRRPGPARPRHGFTLIELLVVISIISLLISILMPTLRSARESARDVQCKSHLRQAGQVLRMYATDDGEGRLIPGWLFGDSNPDRPYWYGQMGRYMGRPNDPTDDPTVGFGTSYLRCPSQFEDAYHTYGVNYDVHRKTPWYSLFDTTGTTFVLGKRMQEVHTDTYLIGDSSNRDWSASDNHVNLRAEINTPDPTQPWGLTVDWDGDGLNDSASAFVDASGNTSGWGPYNAWGPVHSDTGNFVFPDGRVEGVGIREWATNGDGRLWHTNEVAELPPLPDWLGS